MKFKSRYYSIKLMFKFLKNHFQFIFSFVCLDPIKFLDSDIYLNYLQLQLHKIILWGEREL